MGVSFKPASRSLKRNPELLTLVNKGKPPRKRRKTKENPMAKRTKKRRRTPPRDPKTGLWVSRKRAAPKRNPRKRAAPKRTVRAAPAKAATRRPRKRAAPKVRTMLAPRKPGKKGAYVPGPAKHATRTITYTRKGKKVTRKRRSPGNYWVSGYERKGSVPGKWRYYGNKRKRVVKANKRRRVRRTYRKNQSWGARVKVVLFGGAGYFASRLLSGFVLNKLGDKIPAGVAPHAKPLMAGVMFGAAVFGPPKVKVLKDQHVPLMVGAGIALLQEVIDHYAPENVKQLLAPAPVMPAAVEGMQQDLDAYERALASRGMLGAFVPTALAQQEGLGSYIDTAEAEQMGLGAYVPASLSDQEGLGGMFSSAQAGDDEVVGLGPTLTEALGAVGVSVPLAAQVASAVRSTATKVAARGGTPAQAAQAATIVAQQHQLDLTPTIQSAVANEVKRVFRSAGSAAMSAVDNIGGGMGGIFERHMFQRARE